jgi:hypothetical protein
MQDDNVTVKDDLISTLHLREIKAASIKQERQSEQSRLEKLKIRLKKTIQARETGQPEAA